MLRLAMLLLSQQCCLAKICTGQPWCPEYLSAQHLHGLSAAECVQAAVNYGQFDYAGFMPNYPTNARQPLPEPGSQEETAFLQDPEAFLLDSLPNKSDAMQASC